MILNQQQLNVFQKNTWTALAKRLDTMGFNLRVFSGSKSAGVISQETGVEIGKVTREMIEEEELEYILSSRLDLVEIM